MQDPFILCFWFEPILLFKEYFDNSSRAYFLAIAKNLLALSIGLFLFGKIGLLFKSQNWVEFLIKAMIVAIISAAFATIVYLRSEGTKIIFSHVKQILQK